MRTRIVKQLVGVALATMIAAAPQAASADDGAVRLGDVVVTATKGVKEAKDVTQSVTVITGDDIRTSGAANVSEAVRTAAGVVLNDQGAAGSLQTASIRGSSYGQVLVLVDGMRVNSPRDSGFDLSALPVALEDIERIEVVRGAASALYGSDAVGGVVNVITKKPSEAVQNRFGVSIGSHGFDAVTLGSSAKQGSWYYAMSGKRETYDGYRENSDMRRHTFNGKLGYDLSTASSLELTADYTNKENGAPGSTMFSSKVARQKDRLSLYGLSYREKIGDAADLFVQGSRMEEILRYWDTGYGMYGLHKSTSDAGEGRVSFLAGTWNLFTLGAESRKDKLDSSDSGKHETTISAGYLQDEISLGQSLILLLGGRYDDHSVYGENFSPRASARYLIAGSGTIIRASYGESFRGPTFNDLYWSDPFGNVGNPALRPESSTEYEAGIEQALSAKNMIKATWFERKVKDLIDWQEYAPFQYTPVNIGKADIKGVEAEASFKFGESAGLSVSYTYANPVDEITGEKIYYTIPKDQIKGALMISLDESTYLHVEGRSVKNYVKPGESEWKYSVFDAKLGQRILKGRSEIYFGMKNIFDRSYETVRNYPMPPKEIYGGMTYTF